MISQLLNADKKLNATIARKHVELQEIFRASRVRLLIMHSVSAATLITLAPLQIPKIIRLYIFNEYAHQDTPVGSRCALLCSLRSC